MGNSISKVEQAVQAAEEKASDSSLPSTSILTPKTRVLDLDPRSPSANIVRTPIEVTLTPNRETFCESENLSTDILDDPRSPTTDFTRTPIVIYNKTDSSLPSKLHNKNLDNVRKAIKPCLPTHMKTKNAPKLLESSPITPKPASIKRRSFAGLLETNLDFVETDLDLVMKQKLPEEMSAKAQIINEIESTEDEQKEVNKITAPKTEMQTEENKSSSVNTKDFNKKLANLIYEDNEVYNSPIKNVISSESNRTPLGERNSNTDVNLKKSQPKLKVSDKPKKFDKEMSKIPVFKDKWMREKFRQCENTPPNKTSNLPVTKPKPQQWDQNNTLII